jgi:hypothetical protein
VAPFTDNATMLNDIKAEGIIAKAEQKNVARSDRPSFDFEHIFEDFFPDRCFKGERILDIGPGQYDFARAIRSRGGLCDNLDRDPAVLELGEYLGFRVIDADLTRFDPAELAAEYDGIFCKGSINAHWYGTPSGVTEFSKKLDAMIKPGGWGWFAPWNGRGNNNDANACASCEAAQRAAFSRCGWVAYEPGDKASAYYGIGYTVPQRIVYLKNVAPSYRLINDAAPRTPRRAPTSTTPRLTLLSESPLQRLKQIGSNLRSRLR